jgi:uncharacterized protein (TIGR03663 family)
MSAWPAAAVCVVTVAMLLRLYALDLKPLHHDEAVNALILTRLVDPPHEYRYVPANYHGPTLYYFGWLSTIGLGLTTVALRAVPAIFGLLTVLLALSLRRVLGSTGALTAATLIAISPGAVYFSRYFIHEALLVCMTLAAVAAAWRIRTARPLVPLTLTAASAALMFATKETAIVSAAVLITAAVGAAIVTGTNAGAGIFIGANATMHTVPSAAARLRAGGRRFVWPGLAAVLVFVAVSVVFYSSWFTNWQGVPDALSAFAVWRDTGQRVHVERWYAYLAWLTQAEAPLLLLGLAAAIVMLWRRDSGFAVFVALWTCGTITAYSLIPYKTPWLVLNMIVPLALCSGYLAERLRGHARSSRGASVLALAGAAIGIILVAQSIILNFARYDDDRHPYVYVHTQREVLTLIGDIEAVSQRAPTPVTIAVTSRDQFPLSWYLRSYRVGYYGTTVATGDPIVVGSVQQERTLRQLLGPAYVRVGRYPLRPGVRLVLFVRRDWVASR